jgi:hypothetical protein
MNTHTHTHKHQKERLLGGLCRIIKKRFKVQTKQIKPTYTNTVIEIGVNSLTSQIAYKAHLILFNNMLQAHTSNTHSIWWTKYN